MEPLKLQNFYKFFHNSTKLWNFNKFLSPAQISWKYHKFCPPNKFDKMFTSFSHKIDKVFVLHKFEKILQVFVPPTNMIDNIFPLQKCTSRIVTCGDVPTR